MPKKQYTSKAKKHLTRRFARHIDFRLLENTPTKITDYCPEGCLQTGDQTLVERRAATTRHGSHYGVLITAAYRCDNCGHVYISSAWRKNLQQMSFVDMVKVSDES